MARCFAATRTNSERCMMLESVLFSQFANVAATTLIQKRQLEMWSKLQEKEELLVKEPKKCDAVTLAPFNKDELMRRAKRSEKSAGALNATKAAAISSVVASETQVPMRSAAAASVVAEAQSIVGSDEAFADALRWLDEERNKGSDENVGVDCMPEVGLSGYGFGTDAGARSCCGGDTPPSTVFAGNRLASESTSAPCHESSPAANTGILTNLAEVESTLQRARKAAQAAAKATAEAAAAAAHRPPKSDGARQVAEGEGQRSSSRRHRRMRSDSQGRSCSPRDDSIGTKNLDSARSRRSSEKTRNLFASARSRSRCRDRPPGPIQRSRSRRRRGEHESQSREDRSIKKDCASPPPSRVAAASAVSAPSNASVAASTTRAAEHVSSSTGPVVTGAAAERNRRANGWDDRTGTSANTQAPSRPAPVTGAGRNHKVMRLPAIQIRALLGRGGQTINDVRARSGADIKIHHPPQDEWGSVSIVGNVELCEFLINEALAAKNVPILQQTLLTSGRGLPPAYSGGGGSRNVMHGFSM
eukprot:TRINITY_DN16414_c0_g1_i3.p1 TRINITY_DN16414_c0_g1~~TRINITY_DN16414_c0_g1_i3.p1  ORF type:complete len:531 (-),score=83.68 TRINITY_DN16414_c0_g1_i3:10-1602(-)